MTVKQHLTITGLDTDGNGLADGTDGALEIAREVVIRRTGFVEPRPGFDVESDDPQTLVSLLSLIPYDGDVLHIGPDVEGDGDPYNTYWPDADEVVRDGNDEALVWNDGARRGCEARSNLYITTADGVRRLTSSEDVDALLAGVVPPTLLYALEGGSAGLVGDGEFCAYRAIFEVTLANGLVLKSAPSGRVVYANNSGGAKNPEVGVGGAVPEVPDAVVKLKIYRSYITTSSNPSDEMYLMAEVDVSNGGTLATTYDDLIPNLFLGEALYTNPKQEGVRRQNVRPPACKDLALFNKSLFFANITRHARKVFAWNEGGDLSAVADGIGRRAYTGKRTNGSATITLMSDTTGLKPGMIFPDPTSWNDTVPVFIVSVNSGASTVTMSETWGGATDGGTAAIEFDDALWVVPGGDTSFTATQGYPVGGGLLYLLQGLNGAPTVSSRMVASTVAFGVGVSEVSRYEDTTYQTAPGPRSVQIEAYSAADSVQLFATHGSAYTPALPEFDDVVNPSTLAIDGDPYLLEPEHLPNYIGWSKADEPEHHVLGAVEGVGHQKNPLARIVSARNALWIFKTESGDGIYRLSGFGERSGWRVDKIDTDSHLLTPDLLTAHEDIVYMWSDKGMVAVSDAGPIPISRNLIGSDTRPIERYTTPATLGGFAVTNRKDHEVIFGLPGDETDEAAVVYVWNVKTAAFTTWFYLNPIGFNCAAYAEDGLLYLGSTASGWARVERESDRIDLATIVLITDVDGDVVTIAGGTGYDPVIGDVISQGPDLVYVTAVDSATMFTVHDGSVLADGSATALTGYECVVAWSQKVAEGPSVLKRHREAITHWDSREGVRTWTLAFNSYIGSTNSGLQEYTNDMTASLAVAADYRALVGRSFALASRVIPGVYIRQALAKWRLGGITMVSDPVTTKGSVHR